MKTKLCRPILIECKESILHLSHNKLIDSIEIAGENDLYKSTPQQLILISLDPDEKIEVGDLVLTTISELEIYNRIETFENRCDSIYCKKIIATQNQLSPEYIQQFIEEYNKDEVKDVEIEWEFEEGEFLTELEDCPYCPEINRPKLTNGFVTIVEKELERGITIKNADEPITYTEEEVLERLNNLNDLLEENNTYRILMKE